MKYMIHLVPARYLYVRKYLIPSMFKQGIRSQSIMFHEDAAGDGNLKSTLKSFEALPKTGYTWHIQDDVIISSDFYQKTQELEGKVICGFASIYDKAEPGIVKPADMWYSFTCIKIPNSYAREFVQWVNYMWDDENPRYFVNILNNSFDDFLFKEFMMDKHPEDDVLNVVPNLVNHIDYLIGGSTQFKREELIVSKYWEEPELIDKLKKELQ